MKNTISEEECFAPIVELITMEKNDFPPVAIYVHGLASGATGTTFNVLARKLKQYKWITADFGEDIECNVAMLDGMIVNKLTKYYNESGKMFRKLISASTAWKPPA